MKKTKGLLTMALPYLFYLQASDATELNAEFELEHNSTIMMIHCNAEDPADWEITYEIPEFNIPEQIFAREVAAKILVYEPGASMIFPAGTIFRVTSSTSTNPQVVIHLRKTAISLIG